MIEIDKKVLLALIETWWFCNFWAINQVSTTSGYQVTWFYGHFTPATNFWGGSQPMVGGNWLKSIFFLFLDHLPGFPNYTFLNFQKKIFSLHPIAQ